MGFALGGLHFENFHRAAAAGDDETGLGAGFHDLAGLRPSGIGSRPRFVDFQLSFREHRVRAGQGLRTADEVHDPFRILREVDQGPLLFEHWK
jgi:hypothetical protein